MKNKKVIIITIVVIAILICVFGYSNTGLKGLEKQVDNIALPENVDKIALKSKIGDSGGNGDYSTYRVVLVVKTKMQIEELKQEFNNMNLKFKSHYKNHNNRPIFYITHCKSSIFKSDRDFSLSFKELTKVEDYTNYYFIEFVE